MLPTSSAASSATICCLLSLGWRQRTLSCRWVTERMSVDLSRLLRSCFHIYFSKIFDTRLYILTICLIFNRSDKLTCYRFILLSHKIFMQIIFLIIRYQYRPQDSIGIYSKIWKNRKDLYPFWNTSLLVRNTQSNKYLGILHCKTHENCWIINVEKLTSVLGDFQMKKVFNFFILYFTKNPSVLILWIFSSKKRWQVKKETIIFTFSLSMSFEVFLLKIVKGWDDL